MIIQIIVDTKSKEEADEIAERILETEEKCIATAVLSDEQN
jgi:capsular polysaccharide biosynthesis protein